MSKIKLYITGLFCFAVIFGLSVLILINNTSPDRVGNILLFYFFVFCLLFCVFTVLAFYLRRMFGQRELQNLYLRLSAREGLWLTIIFVGSLFLLSHKFFSWLNAVLLVLIFVFLESYLLSKNNN